MLHCTKEISTTDRTHARTGPDKQHAQAHNHTQNNMYRSPVSFTGTGSKTPGGAGTHCTSVPVPRFELIPKDTGGSEPGQRDTGTQRHTHTDSDIGTVLNCTAGSPGAFEPRVRPHRRPLRVCCARLHLADRLRAGAGRRSGSGSAGGGRVGTSAVRWGRPLLSRPWGALGSTGAAAGC